VGSGAHSSDGKSGRLPEVFDRAVEHHFVGRSTMEKIEGFEWDDAKREINLTDHRIDFLDVPLVFDGPHLIRPSSRRGERRLLAIGFLDDREVTIVFTIRNGKRRIISARRARTDERQALQDAAHRLGSKA